MVVDNEAGGLDPLILQICLVDFNHDGSLGKIYLMCQCMKTMNTIV